MRAFSWLEKPVKPRIVPYDDLEAGDMFVFLTDDRAYIIGSTACSTPVLVVPVDCDEDDR